MNEITVIEMQGQLVVDSRLIAENLGILHRGLMQTIRNHQTAIEYFGAITFEMLEFKTSQGNTTQEQFAYLNEEQATFVMTLSRNTPKVIKCKQNLVSAFSKAKKAINQIVPLCQTLAKENELLKSKLQNIPARKQFSIHYDGRKFYLCTTYKGKVIPLFEQMGPDNRLALGDYEAYLLALNESTQAIEAICEAFNNLAKILTPVR